MASCRIGKSAVFDKWSRVTSATSPETATHKQTKQKMVHRKTIFNFFPSKIFGTMNMFHIYCHHRRNANLTKHKPWRPNIQATHKTQRYESMRWDANKEHWPCLVTIYSVRMIRRTWQTLTVHTLHEQAQRIIGHHFPLLYVLSTSYS